MTDEKKEKGFFDHFTEEELKEMRQGRAVIDWSNPFIHIDYSPEWHEEMRKATEGMRFLFDPEDMGS